jgi:hypothetical protein
LLFNTYNVKSIGEPSEKQQVERRGASQGTSVIVSVASHDSAVIELLIASVDHITTQVK